MKERLAKALYWAWTVFAVVVMLGIVVLYAYLAADCSERGGVLVRGYVLPACVATV